jgi:hypothetical protein
MVHRRTFAPWTLPASVSFLAACLVASLGACGSGSPSTDGGTTDSGNAPDSGLPPGIACTAPFGATANVVVTLTGPDMAVAAQLLGSETASLTYNCAASAVPLDQVPENQLSYFSGGHGAPFFGASLSIAPLQGGACPGLDAGAAFDVSKSACLGITGSVNFDGEDISFTNQGASAASASSGTFTLTAFSAQDGGTVAGAFDNAVFPTSGMTGGSGQVLITGSYSAVNSN